MVAPSSLAGRRCYLASRRDGGRSGRTCGLCRRMVQRTLPRHLYERVAALPIISPHGHVDPALLADNQPFPDPAELFIRRDHYVTRLIHAAGVALERLGVRELADGAGAVVSAREAWRAVCAHW